MAQEGFSFFSQQYRTSRGSWCETLDESPTIAQKKRGSVDSAAFVPAQLAELVAQMQAGNNSPPETADAYPEEGEWPDLVELSATKPGSKQVQAWICGGTGEQVQFILQMLSPHFLRLSQDPCGNYVCQKLLQHCTAPDRHQLLTSLMDYLLELSLHPISTHVIQTLVSLLSLPEELQLVLTWLQQCLLPLARHEYGTHVVQKLLVTCKSPVIALVAQNFVSLATDKFGIGVVKRSVSEAITDSDRNILWQEMARRCLVLAQDPFGNYAVQHMLDEWPNSAVGLYRNALAGRITQLSLQKCSSNVVEKCVDKVDAATLNSIVAEVAQPGRLSLLVSNSYGIYVLRSLLKAVSGEAKAALKTQIRNALGQVQQVALRSRTEALLQE